MKTTHLVLKWDDICRACSDQECFELGRLVGKIQYYRELNGKKKVPEYYVVNQDEPYAQEVLDVIMRGL